MKKILALTLAILMVMSMLAGCGAAEKEEAPAAQEKAPAEAPAAAEKTQENYRITIGTGNSGAVFYVLGAGMADTINKTSDILDVTAQATSATSENLAGVQAHEFDFGFSVYDVADCAYKGIREYEEQGAFENLRVACIGHTGAFVPFVYDDSPIQSLADMASGKYKMAVSSGFTGYWLAKVALEGYGVDIETVGDTPVMSHTEQSTAMKDGTINVQCFTGPSPASAMMDTSSQAPIRVLEQTDETLNGLADLRGKTPKERAELIIEKCCHPDYRPALREYYEHAKTVSKGQHTPHDLKTALSWHQRYLETGSMK